MQADPLQLPETAGEPRRLTEKRGPTKLGDIIGELERRQADPSWANEPAETKR